MCALMSWSACSLSSEKVLTPQQCRIDSPGRHHDLVIKSPVMHSLAWLSTFIGAAFALPAKAMAAQSALSGEGKPRCACRPWIRS
jgi:hypothetical protein